MKPLLFLLAFLAVGVFCTAQTPSPADSLRFGDITAANFQPSPLAGDADAIVLADIGSTLLEGYEEGFRTVFIRHRRILILKPAGMDAAKVSMRFSEEMNSSSGVRSLKACTYNLVNGQVTKTPLEKKDYFIDKIGKDLREQRFAFPNARVGAIVEYIYTVRSGNIFQLRPWAFQGRYPVVLSVYTARIPDIVNYVIIPGGRKADAVLTETGEEKSTVVGATWFTTHLHSTTWVMRNVAPLKDEPYISTLDNYFARLRFQLSFMPVNGHAAINVLPNWKSVSDELLNNDRFGKTIFFKQPWMDAEIGGILAGADAPEDKAKRLFAFVRDKFKASGAGIWLTEGQTLKDVYTRRQGSEADINLLLIAMLRAANLAAEPVILSTKENGAVSTSYPFIEDYNYLICRLIADGHVYYLDASRSQLGFGRLGPDCYNGYARVIDKVSYPVYLLPDSLKETKTTTVSLTNDKAGMSGGCVARPGYFESLNIRNELGDKSIIRYLQDENKDLPAGISIDTTTAVVDSQYRLEEPVAVRYGLHVGFNGEKLVYFNPMLNFGVKRNPFTSAGRSFPVEMPYQLDETYVLNMEVPKGYHVEEMPQPASVGMVGGYEIFEYGLEQKAGVIQLKCRGQIKKAVFEPEDYDTLREFYSTIVKKENEMIVLKADQ